MSFRVRLTQALADLAGRPLAEAQSVVWSIPEGRDEVVFAQTFPVSYDTIQAASDTLGGALPGGQTLLFHGLWTDPATGLAYARNRWYDPRTASWLSEDPLRDFDSPNLYAYGAWQPQMYRDPEGLWVETLWDVASVVWDVYELRKDPKSVSNWVALVADVGAAVLPCLPAGAGAALHGGKAGKAVAKALSHADELADAEKALDRLGDTEKLLTHGDEATNALKAERPALHPSRVAEALPPGGALPGLERFESIGREGIPAVLVAYGDAVRPMGKIPSAFEGRRVTTLGRTWDIEAAKELGGFRVLDDPKWSIERNYEWLLEAIENGDVFYLATPVTEATLKVDDPYHGVWRSFRVLA